MYNNTKKNGATIAMSGSELPGITDVLDEIRKQVRVILWFEGLTHGQSKSALHRAFWKHVRDIANIERKNCARFIFPQAFLYIIYIYI